MMPHKRPFIGHGYRYLTTNQNMIHFLLRLCTITINVLMILQFVENDGDIEFRNDWGERAIWMTGLIHV
jgi:hypothetical protein